MSGLKDALNKRKITIVSESDGVLSIDARGGVFIGEVLPPSETDKKKRVVRFSKIEEDYLDPALFGYVAKLGTGLEILFVPLEKPGDL